MDHSIFSKCIIYPHFARDETFEKNLHAILIDKSYKRDSKFV